MEHSRGFFLFLFFIVKCPFCSTNFTWQCMYLFNKTFCVIWLVIYSSSFEVKFLVWNQAVWSVFRIVLVYVICEFFCFQNCISSLILLLSFHHNLTPLPLSDSEFWKQLFWKIIMSRNNKSLKPELCEVVKRVWSEQKEGNPRRQCHLSTGSPARLEGPGNPGDGALRRGMQRAGGPRGWQANVWK